MSDRRVVAEGTVTRLEVCPCGTCYLTIGPVTVALQQSAVEELGATIGRALRALRAERALLDLSSRSDGGEAAPGEVDAGGGVPGASAGSPPETN